MTHLTLTLVNGIKSFRDRGERTPEFRAWNPGLPLHPSEQFSTIDPTFVRDSPPPRQGLVKRVWNQCCAAASENKSFVNEPPRRTRLASPLYPPLPSPTSLRPAPCRLLSSDKAFAPPPHSLPLPNPRPSPPPNRQAVLLHRPHPPRQRFCSLRSSCRHPHPEEHPLPQPDPDNRRPQDAQQGRRHRLRARRPHRRRLPGARRAEA